MRLPDPADLKLLNLSFDAEGGRGRFELIHGLGRHDGALYGGTGIAVSVTAMEAATAREALWVTTQFVATVQLGAVIDVATDVLASGRAISQVQVTARHEGRTLFVALGSTATPRTGGLDGQYETMPAVAPPEDSEPMQHRMPGMEDRGGLHDNVEYRVARVLEPDGSGPPGGRPTMAMWARLTGGRRCTRAGIAFLADMVPPAIAHAAGKVGGGPSLDNSLRFGRLDVAPEWILLDLRGHMAYGAHGHGSVWVWSPDGGLLAIGDQSANMVHTMDLDEAGLAQ